MHDRVKEHCCVLEQGKKDLEAKNTRTYKGLRSENDYV